MASAASTPTMATTIINSTSVKPRLFRSFLIMVFSLFSREGGALLPSERTTRCRSRRFFFDRLSPVRTLGFPLLAFVFRPDLRREARADEQRFLAARAQITDRFGDVPGTGRGRPRHRLREPGIRRCVAGAARRARVPELYRLAVVDLQHAPVVRD